MNTIASVKKYLKSIAFKHAVKLLLYFPMFTLRCTSKAQFLIKNVIILWSRISNKLFTYPGENDLDDRLYNYAANEILHIKGSEDLYKGLDQTQITIIIENTKKVYSSEIEQALQDFKKLEKNFSGIKSNLNKLMDNDKDFNKLINESLKDCRRIKKSYSNYKKNATAIISDYRAEDHKLSLNLIDSIKTIGIFSPIFALIGGYLYVWNLFRWFSIDASSFFSVNDYITASLTQLIRAFVYVLLIVVAILLSKNERAREPNYVTKRYDIHDKYFIFPIALVAIIFIIFIGLFYHRPDHLYVGVALISIVFLPHILNRYTKISITAFIFIFGFIIYISQILSYSYLEYKNIIDKKSNESLMLTFKNKNIKVPFDASFILNNSEYFFYYDHETKSIILIPMDEVELITKKSSSS